MKKLSLFIFTLVLTGCSFGQQLLNVSIDSFNNEDRVIMEFSAEAAPKMFTLKDPERVVIDFEGAVWNGAKREILSDSPRLSKIRWAQNSFSPGIARVVVDVKEGIETELVKEKEGRKHTERILSPEYAPQKNQKFISAVCGNNCKNGA